MKLMMLLCVLVLSAPAFAGLVVNGTMDSNCANWSFTNTDGFTCATTGGNPGGRLILNNGPTPPNAPPQASQSILGLEIGKSYLITWDASSHYNCCNPSSANPAAGVQIDGELFEFKVVNNQPWTPYSYSFVYNGGSNVLVLSSQRNGIDADAQFDNVDINLVVSAVPEPSSVLLVLGGFLATLAVRNRRKAGN
jgi:hypothetical protein